MTAKILRVVAAVGLAGALASCALFDGLERELVFRPVTQDWGGYSRAILEEEEVWIPVGTAGERLQAWWLASPGATQTIVYFHGARVNLTGSVYRLRGLRGAGYNVLAIDYRGYGRSSPRLPSEASVYEDGLAAWRWLDARAPERGRRILYGHSLGGAVAAEVALRGGGGAALVLESAFTSLQDIHPLAGHGAQRLNVLAKMPAIAMPVLVLHGAGDRLVPPAMAQQLYDAARGPKRMILVEDAGHRWVVARAGREAFDALRELAAPALQRGAGAPGGSLP